MNKANTATMTAAVRRRGILAVAVAGVLMMICCCCCCHSIEAFTTSTSFLSRRSSLQQPPPPQQQQQQQYHEKRTLIVVHTALDSNNSHSSDSSSSDQLDKCISNKDLLGAVRVLKTSFSSSSEGGSRRSLNKDQLVSLMNAVEDRTAEPDENNVQFNDSNYPIVSKARKEMSEVYNTLADVGELTVYGAAGSVQSRPYPAEGSKIVTPVLLETITGFPMSSLTPKGSSNLFIFAGLGAFIVELILSAVTGVDLNYFIFGTLMFAVLDKIFVNGAVGESFLRILYPQYSRKVLLHEAGHFLTAYLLGLPVEGCVISGWSALKDERFRGKVTAGTSFFDPILSDEINVKQSVTRTSMDKYSVVVMAGIAAEAINFNQAEGGGGDEVALTTFLSQVTGNTWNLEKIKNQARWGACQAVLLLKEYSPCYDALVKTLEKGGKLGDCIYAIEEAARQNNLKPLSLPKGIITETPPFGEFQTKFSEEDLIKNGAVAVQTPDASKVVVDPEQVYESINQSRKQLEEKLRIIEQQLKDIES